MDVSELKGRYKAKAQEWGLGQSSKGTEQVGVLFELTEGDAKGIRITWYGSFSEAAAAFTLKGLRACGWEGTDVLELETAHAGLDKNEVSLVIEQEEYQGKTSAKVQWVNPIGGVGLKTPLDPAQKQSFAARMKQFILAEEAGTAKPAATKPVSSAAPRRDPRPSPPPLTGDIPF